MIKFIVKKVRVLPNEVRAPRDIAKDVRTQHEKIISFIVAAKISVRKYSARTL